MGCLQGFRWYKLQESTVDTGGGIDSARENFLNALPICWLRSPGNFAVACKPRPLWVSLICHFPPYAQARLQTICIRVIQSMSTTASGQRLLLLPLRSGTTGPAWGQTRGKHVQQLADARFPERVHISSESHSFRLALRCLRAQRFCLGVGV